MSKKELEEGWKDWLDKVRKKPEPSAPEEPPGGRRSAWEDYTQEQAKEELMNMASKGKDAIWGNMRGLKGKPTPWDPRAAFAQFPDLMYDRELKMHWKSNIDIPAANRQRGMVPGHAKTLGWDAMVGQGMEADRIRATLEENSGLNVHFNRFRNFAKSTPEPEPEDEMELLKEYFYSFVPMINFTDKTWNNIRPPASSIEEVLTSWAMDDLKIYEDLMSAGTMGYHVMLPTKEVCDVMNVDLELGYPGSNRERVDRRRRIVEEGEVHQPVVIALGRNGKASIVMGSKHLIAAHDAGLKEVPIVFEYRPRV